jgi:hypothetical protein
LVNEKRNNDYDPMLQPINIKFGTYYKKGLVLGPRHDDVSLSKITTHVLKDSTFINSTVNNEGRLK